MLKRFSFSLAFAGARVRASASDWLWFVCLKKKKNENESDCSFVGRSLPTNRHVGCFRDLTWNRSSGASAFYELIQSDVVVTS
jgi:hypothetical protein